jgi:hypothetical protein
MCRENDNRHSRVQRFFAQKTVCPLRVPLPTPKNRRHKAINPSQNFFRKFQRPVLILSNDEFAHPTQ